MKTSLALLLLFSLVSCNKTKVASSTKGSINAEAPYLWPSMSAPKHMLISEAFSAEEVTKIKAMGNRWYTALNSKRQFFSFEEGATELTVGIASGGALAEGIFGIYRSNPWLYPEYPDALAVTQIFGYRYNRGTPSEYVSMEEADIIMNYQNFAFGNGTSGKYDFETVMLHEMGHFLGLGHRKTANRTDTVMYPTIYHWEVKKDPQNLDINDLASKYNINLGGGANPSMAGSLPTYQPMTAGEPVRIILELKADGECVHHEDGAVVLRHHVNLK